MSLASADFGRRYRGKTQQEKFIIDVLSTWSHYELLRESSEKSNNSFVDIAMHDFFFLARKYSYAYDRRTSPISVEYF